MVFNEVTTLIVIWLMVTFTTYIENTDAKNIVGYCVLFFIFFNILVNFVLQMIDLVKEIIAKYKAWKEKKKSKV